MKLRSDSTVLALSLGGAGVLVLASNLPFWSALTAIVPADSPAHVFFLASTFVILLSTLTLIFSLVAFRYVLKPVVIGALLIAAICSHFMNAYGVVIDRSMIQNIVETDAQEVKDLLGTGLVLHVLLLGVLPALVVARVPLRFGPLRREATTRLLAAGASLVVSAALIGGGFKEFALIGREHGQLRLLINPISPIYAAVTYAIRDRSPRVVARIGEDARRPDAVVGRSRKSVVVLVVGEAARAASFSLNGYARETNPRLATYPVINFTNVWSCGTATAVSLPCMFSPDGRGGFDGAKLERQESLVDVLQRAGVSVLWRDNNSGCKHVCDRVAQQGAAQLQVSEFCDAGACFDEVLLQKLQGFIDELPSDALIVLHQKGSHGPAYHKRTPVTFKRFLPECAVADVQDCSRESLVNAYDNTILYTDFVLSRVIDLLQANAARFDTAMLYVSDHGESLGENGIYLHGLPWFLAPAEQKRVPMLLWLSRRFAAELGIDAACLERRRHDPYSHDHLFHSILGLFDVQTAVYAPGLDLFAACRRGGPPAGETVTHAIPTRTGSGRRPPRISDRGQSARCAQSEEAGFLGP